MTALTTDIFQFAYINFKSLLTTLNEIAAKETWSYKDKSIPTQHDFPILENYIRYTYDRLANLYNKASDVDKNKYIYIKDDCACFNTGLYTSNFNSIYAYFKKNKIPNKQQWWCIGFFEESEYELIKFVPLPLRAKYVSKIEDLIYDTDLELRIDIDHILKDPENVKRIPEKIKSEPNILTIFKGAYELAKKRICSNYKTAVPHFHNNHIQLLIPISLQSIETTDLVLVVEKYDNIYRGNTCLTLDQAYNNARLIAKPEVEWLMR